MNWWNTLSNYEQVVIISTSIPVLFVVIVSGLAVSHTRREKRERRLLEAAVEAEPLAPPEAYEAGTFTPEERAEEQPRPVYMDVPYRPLPPEDPSRPYIRLKWHEPDEPMGRL